MIVDPNPREVIAAIGPRIMQAPLQANTELRMFRLGLIVTLALLLAPVSNAFGADDAKPNVVLVLVDDLGWMDLSCQGSDFYQTPNIDKLAATGVRFTHGYAACAVCSPTRAAIQTGRYPHRIGITDWIRAAFQGGERKGDANGYVSNGKRPLRTPINLDHLPHDEITLAETLKTRGYASCFIGKWHLGGKGNLPTDQGYDENHGGWDYGQPPSYFDPYKTKRLPKGIPTLPPRSEGEYLSDREGAEAVSFIERHKDKPFFLCLANYAVHTPIQAKKDVTERYAKRKDGKGQDNPAYAAMVESVDDAVGQITKTLDELKLTDNTIIIFTSDNGGLDRGGNPTENAPLKSGKGYNPEGGIRVPWIIRWPNVTAVGATTDQPICSVDLFPTIAAACGVAPSDQPIDGIDITPALRGKPLPNRALYWHFPHYRHGPGNDPYSMIREGDYKLIRTYDPIGVKLYNLKADQAETHDLAAKHPEIVQRLQAKLDAHLKATDAKLPLPASP